MDASVEAHVLKCTQWTKLPPEIRSHFGNNEKEYYKGVLAISVQHQLRWEGNLGKLTQLQTTVFRTGTPSWTC